MSSNHGDWQRRLHKHYTGRTILVTGGFGFLGSHLTRKLVEFDAKVTVLDLFTEKSRNSLINDGSLRDQLTIEQGDITDRKFLDRVINSKQFQNIFHFAAYATVVEKAVVNPGDTINANTMGLVNLLEAIRTSEHPKLDCIFHASTDKVYGETDGTPYDEDRTPLRGIGVYDSAKLAADVFARTYKEAFGLPTVVMRLCNIFGPYDFNVDYRLVPKAMKALFGAVQPEAPELYFDSLGHSRDYLYVDDCIEAILRVGIHVGSNSRWHGEVYNLMGCRHLSTPEMLKTIVSVAEQFERGCGNGKRADAIREKGILIKVRTQPVSVITIKTQQMTGGKLKEATEFEPRVQLETGLAETAKYYRDHFCKPLKSSASSRKGR